MKAAGQLAGKTLDEKWKILEMISKPPEGTGGHFSVGYLAENISDGTRVFVKALDFSSAAQSNDPLRKTQEMLEAFNFERTLLERCSGSDRIMTPIAHGILTLPVYGIFGTVPFLIFELAQG